MKCEDFENLQHALIDQELDPSNAQEVVKHHETCPSCASKFNGLVQLRQDIKAHATRHVMPHELENKLTQIVSAPTPSRVRFLRPFQWASAGATLALAACLSLFILTRPSEQYLTEQQVITSHVRSLQDGHLIDVVSTDQHTVKPWFNGRLDLSPPVVDLSGKGFTLVGGRLDYINRHTAAVIVYRYNAHIINLFVWPSEQVLADLDVTLTQQGYNLRHWHDGDLQFWSISDVNPVKLAEFETLYREQNPNVK